MKNVSSSLNQLIIEAYLTHHSSVIAYISKRIGNYEAARDLSQDVFIRLIEYKQTLCPDKIRNLLFTMAHNLAVDYLRRSQKLQEVHNRIQSLGTASSNETEETIIVNDLLSLEKDRLSSLVGQRKLVYSMVRFENQELPQVAKELSLSIRTVENYLQAGRKDIRTFLKKYI